MKIKIGILIFIIIQVSCTQRNKLHILDKAEQYAYQYNDSALILIEKIASGKLTEEELARYYLIENMISYTKEKGKISDSTLHISEDYFRRVLDNKRLAEVLLLQGWSRYMMKNFDHSQQKYNEALGLWMLLNDSSKIIRTYRELSWVANRTNQLDSACLLMYKALPYGTSLDRLHIFMNLGDLYAAKGKLQEAIDAYNQSYVEAQKRDSRSIYQTIRNKLVDLYLHNNMHEEAFRELDAFRKMRKGRYEISYSTLARAEIWMKVHQYDSACYYYTLASQSLNSHVATEANSRLADLYSLKGDYKDAVSALRTFAELWESKAGTMESDHLRKDYEEVKLKNELNETKLAKRNRELYLLIFFIIVSLSIIIGYIFYLRNKKNKEQQRLKQQAEILEKENKLLKQAEELSTLREKESGLREALFKKMTVFHKIPSLESGNSKDTDDKRIILSDKDWEELMQIVNSSYDGFADRLKKEYPLLTAKDIQFCCLVKINVTLKDLSDIYCVSKSAITKKKFRIKTEKLGFTDPDKSLDDFLEGF
ncbi:hypothetical protein [Bacteroides sp. 519]|uniref:hypothetical protein n=1 Tax=Bacteroides sp. 519 TaxID=2302937 RepID=UPI0013CFF971|nr:hypothetical protein [Bacteroides sp. 519]NDV58497.1 hypothetical protein [Bacteroides sp. 519]